ncbi:MAG: SRPBCC family protein [Rhodopila sp.]|nr:SRPBCC family protein [Rhodopila sp.]
MATESGREKGTCVSRVIKAPRRTIYQAFLDPKALVSWLPPEGMKGHVYAFDAREGGAYRMSLTYVEPDHSARGKTSEHADVVRGRFMELIPDQRIVQQIEFESKDPAFAGAMTITWTLADVPGGTEVTVLCENEPEGIRPDDHETGLRSTLENLAVFTE